MRRRLLIACVILAAAAVAGSVVMACRAVEPAPVIPSAEFREEMPQTAVLEIQYIANEGVLISSRVKRVLIDGLHRKYEDSYAYLPDAEREKIEAAKPPFDKIDLILVSHRHGDHFHPESVGSYLRSSKATLFASSQQVVDETAAKFAGFAEIKKRVTAIPYELRSRKPMRLADIDVEFLGVGHGSGRHATIQNLGHVITLGGKKVLHIGDADLTPEIFDAFDLETRGIDIAVLPFWFLTAEGGRKIVEQHIKPKHIIATHIGPAEAKQTATDVKKHFPNADVFTMLLEKRSF
jgi:L-ascorbate metabolism protein UlaG (beta-lactamase superfamily)